MPEMVSSSLVARSVSAACFGQSLSMLPEFPECLHVKLASPNWPQVPRSVCLSISTVHCNKRIERTDQQGKKKIQTEEIVARRGRFRPLKECSARMSALLHLPISALRRTLRIRGPVEGATEQERRVEGRGDMWVGNFRAA